MGRLEDFSLLSVCSGAGFMKPCVLLKLDFLTNECILLPALVKKSSFSKAQGFMKTAPDVCCP